MAFPRLLICSQYSKEVLCTKAKEAKCVKGFHTGDMVKVIVVSGSKAETYFRRVAVRTRGSFNITMKQGLLSDIHYTYCKAVHKMDGYSYQKGEKRRFLLIP